MIVSIAHNTYFVPKVREVHLPEDVRIASIEGGEAMERDTKRFYFFPNGSSLGGEIVIVSSANSISYLIRFEPAHRARSKSAVAVSRESFYGSR